LAARILEEYEHDVGAIELVTGAHGVCDVHVDGDLVFTKSMLGRYPDPNDVLPLLRPFLGRR
jgi:predicted Rdx family selenoprotein